MVSPPFFLSYLPTFCPQIKMGVEMIKPGLRESEAARTSSVFQVSSGIPLPREDQRAKLPKIHCQ